MRAFLGIRQGSFGGELALRDVVPRGHRRIRRRRPTTLYLRGGSELLLHIQIQKQSNHARQSRPY